ncbi:MAG: FtsX-like permease family protein [Xanthomonadales bacterium]|nr:FtsX-like permease family protein [Xanthomonadales bacterium]
MFWNNLKVALRNLRKNKLYAVINIAGLSLGLAIYVFGGLLVEYERTHDVFFENAGRTYTVGSVAAADLDVGVNKMGSTFSAVGPIIEAEVSDVEAVARTIGREMLITMGAESFYQQLRFADAEILQIFDFDYLVGDASALDDASGLVVTESTANKYFGSTDVLGEVITMDNEFEFYISAVIRDVPQNSHFNSLFVMASDLEILAPFRALGRILDYDMAGDWSNLSLGNMTYVMLPQQLDQQWLQSQVDGIYERQVPEDTKEVIASLFVKPLSEANLAFWDMIGLPVISVISLLSLLVLIIACVNYTNLATAQSLGRSREVGMRKTMGAGRGQLLMQFLVESLTIAAIAMLVAIAALELVIPLFNSTTDKVLTLNYLSTLPWLLATTIVVGLVAGAYPAWLITRASPIDALRDLARKGKKGSRVRAVMIGAQFAISAFMLSVVTVVSMQNEKVKESSYVFPRSEVYTLGRMSPDEIRNRLDTLRHELEALPHVEHVAYSSQVPYEQNNSQIDIAMQPGDEAGKFRVHYLAMTPEFLDTYGIPVMAGRNLSRDVSNDERDGESEVANVLVNELTLEKMGINSAQDAINFRFFELDDESALREMVIVGVVPTQNITGLFNTDKPWVYMYRPDHLRIGSVRIRGGSTMDTIAEIEDTWDRVIPEYPIQGRFLDEVFDDVYNVLKLLNGALAGFAGVALALALIGLFGLAAFMATQRTREIGIRKVLGANSLQVVRLLVWQFSKPVLWALVIALPLAYIASKTYLDFFADRIDAQVIILLSSGLAAVLLAWGTVAGHAIRISRASPILALRYE